MISKWNFVSHRRQRASLPASSARLIVHLNAWWSVLIIKFVSLRWGSRRRTQEKTKRHSKCLVLRFCSGLFNVVDQYPTGRPLPSFDFWSGTKPTWRFQASVSSENGSMFGSVKTGGKINLSFKTLSVFSSSSLKGSSFFSWDFLSRLDRSGAMFAKMGQPV